MVQFFDYLDRKGIFWITYPPHLVCVVIESPLMWFKIIKTKLSKSENHTYVIKVSKIQNDLKQGLRLHQNTNGNIFRFLP